MANFKMASEVFRQAAMVRTAGHTHYWTYSRAFTDQEWAKITAAAKKIISMAKADGIEVGNGTGKGHPIINSDAILLNGVGDYSAARFYLSKDDDTDFPHCKTYQRPYDAVVVSILAAAEKIAPDVLDVRSDGGRQFPIYRI